MYLKETRRKLGLSQEICARIVNLALPNYNKAENGKFPLTADRYNKLCRFFQEYDKLKEKVDILINFYINN